MERKNGQRPISAVLLLVGVVLTVVGLFGRLLGSPLNEVITPSGSFLKESPGLNDSFSGESFSQELPGLSEITLETAFGNVEVVEGNRSTITGRGFEAGSITTRFENGKLVVRQKERTGTNHLKKFLRNGPETFGTTRIVITVAEDTLLKTVDISHGAGNLTLSGLVADKAELELGAGELQLENAIFDEATFLSGAGNIQMKNINIQRKIKAECGAGNILLSGSLTGDAKLSCGAGNVTANLQGRPDDYRIEAETGIGNIRVDGTGYGKEANIRPQMATYNIEAESGTGNVEINFD